MSAKAPRLSDTAHVAVAVSGGSDSLGVLHALSHGAERPGKLSAVTVDHGLRDGSAEEAARVAKLAESWGVPHTTLKWTGWDGSGNLQDEARKARYRLIADWARENDVDAIVLGHTQNDLAETFLMQLGRRAGLDGLTSMQEAFELHGVWFHRPFLCSARAEFKEHLSKAGVEWIDDPSNDDESFQRVRLRKAIFALEEADVAIADIAEVVANLRSVQDSLTTLFLAWNEQMIREEAGDLVCTVRSYLSMPPAIRHLFLKNGIQWVSGSAYPPRMGSLKKLPVIEGQLVPFTLGGCIIQNFASIPINAPRQPGGPVDKDMRISREFNAVKDVACKTDKLWDGRWVLEGPHKPNLEVRALGEAISDCPNWRETGLPRTTLLSTPSVWHGDQLISAPVAGFSNGWTAKATGRGNFAEFLLSR